MELEGISKLLQTITVTSLRNEDLFSCIFLGALMFSSVIINEADGKNSSM